MDARGAGIRGGSRGGVVDLGGTADRRHRAPATGGTYNVKQQVATSFNCSAPTGGSLKSCVDSNGATGGTGALITSTTGSHSYKVTATDADGQTGTASITYTVVGPPTVKITAPASGQAYEPGQAVSTNFTCTEANGGPRDRHLHRLQRLREPRPARYERHGHARLHRHRDQP